MSGVIRAPALALLLALSVAALAACGDKGSIEDYLPAEEEEAARGGDPFMDAVDDPVRTPTDLDHSVARGKLAELAKQVRAWSAEHGALPASLELLTAGGDMDGGSAIIPDGHWRVPLDPWGTAYVLRGDLEGGFTIRSLGPDKLVDTVDDLIHTEPGGPADDD